MRCTIMLTCTIWSTVHFCIGCMAILKYQFASFLQIIVLYLLDTLNSFITLSALSFIVMLYFSYPFCKVGDALIRPAPTLVMMSCLCLAANFPYCAGLTCTPQPCHLTSHARQALLYQRYTVLGAPWVVSSIAYIAVPYRV